MGIEFEIDGFKGITGRMGETTEVNAIGFSLPADVMQNVYIIEKAK